jgi:hypothetical protein
VEIGFKKRISNNQQGMSNIQLRKRFALLVENLSKWQETFLGHWKLGTGYWIFVFQPPVGGFLMLPALLEEHHLEKRGPG